MSAEAEARRERVARVQADSSRKQAASNAAAQVLADDEFAGFSGREVEMVAGDISRLTFDPLLREKLISRISRFVLADRAMNPQERAFWTRLRSAIVAQGPRDAGTTTR